jgi:hypothetical protein
MNRNHRLAVAVLAAALPFAAIAQSSSGNITGEAVTGDTVMVTGVDTGFKRELKIDKDGKFQIRRVPTGSYQVIVMHKDGTIDPAQNLMVRPGGNARVMEAGKTEMKEMSSGS